MLVTRLCPHMLVSLFIFHYQSSYPSNGKKVGGLFPQFCFNLFSRCLFFLTKMVGRLSVTFRVSPGAPIKRTQRTTINDQSTHLRPVAPYKNPHHRCRPAALLAARTLKHLLLLVPLFAGHLLLLSQLLKGVGITLQQGDQAHELRQWGGTWCDVYLVRSGGG